MANGFEPAGSTHPQEPMTQVLEGLNDLLQLDHDSVGAYEIAQDHLQNPEYVAQIRAFQEDHQRHIRNLNDLILSLGGVPVNEPHATSLLKEGIQRLTASGGDRALLTAWRANELAATRKYAQYARRAAEWPEQARRVVVDNAADEDRHYEWVRSVLGDDGLRPDESPGIRGQLADWQNMLSSESGRAEVRERAAAALDGVAERIDGLAGYAPSGGLRERAAPAAQAAAKGLNAAAEKLRDPASLDPRPRLVEEIRRSPARALLGVFAIGFVIGRLVR